MIPAPSLFVMTFGYSIAGGPRRRYVSDGLTPEASSFTRTSPWPASGVGSSPHTRTSSAAPCRSYQTARMAALILHRFRILAFPGAAGSSGGHRGTLDYIGSSAPWWSRRSPRLQSPAIKNERRVRLFSSVYRQHLTVHEPG